MAAASKKRITFALVIDTRVYNGKMVYADVLDDPGGSLFTTVEASLQSYPNTTNHAWARMTTLEEFETKFLAAEAAGRQLETELEDVRFRLEEKTR